MTTGSGYSTPVSSTGASGNGYGTPGNGGNTTGDGYGTPGQGGSSSGDGYGTPDNDDNGTDDSTGDDGSTSTPSDNGDNGDNDGNSEFDSISKIKLSLKKAIKSSGKKGKELIGTDSSDTIVAGKGVDTMTGKDGADYFVYKQKNNFGKKKADKVTDFEIDDGDKVVIKGKSFSKGTKKEATFAEVNNKKQAKKLAKQDVDFIYEKKSGKLYFNSNADKKGFGDKGGFFGILEGSPELSADDINLI